MSARPAERPPGQGSPPRRGSGRCRARWRSGRRASGRREREDGRGPARPGPGPGLYSAPPQRSFQGGRPRARPRCGRERAGRRAGPGAAAGRDRPARASFSRSASPSGSSSHTSSCPDPASASTGGSFDGVGDGARGQTARSASTTSRTTSSTTRPATCTSSGCWGSSPRRSRGPGAAPGDLMKLPAILADARAGDRRLRAGRRARGEPAGGARRRPPWSCSYPVTWFDSAVWGQVDSVGTLVLLLAVRELWRGQLGAGGDPDHGRGDHQAPVRDPDPDRRGRDPPAPPASTAGSRGRVLLGSTSPGSRRRRWSACPVRADDRRPAAADRRRPRAATRTLTVNAYNPWALVTMDGSGLAASGTWIRTSRRRRAADLLPSSAIPARLRRDGACWSASSPSWRLVAWRRDDPRTLLVALAVMAVAFFVLPTRVHERYLYPFFALGAILAAVRPRAGCFYGVLAVGEPREPLRDPAHGRFYENPGLEPMLDAFGGAGSAWARGSARPPA